MIAQLISYVSGGGKVLPFGEVNPGELPAARIVNLGDGKSTSREISYHLDYFNEQGTRGSRPSRTKDELLTAIKEIGDNFRFIISEAA